MNKRLEANVNTLFNERHGQIVAEPRKENNNHYDLTRRIKEIRCRLGTMLVDETKSLVHELVNLIIVQGEVEGN